MVSGMACARNCESCPGFRCTASTMKTGMGLRGNHWDSQRNSLARALRDGVENGVRSELRRLSRVSLSGEHDEDGY